MGIGGRGWDSRLGEWRRGNKNNDKPEDEDDNKGRTGRVAECVVLQGMRCCGEGGRKGDVSRCSTNSPQEELPCLLLQSRDTLRNNPAYSRRAREYLTSPAAKVWALQTLVVKWIDCSKLSSVLKVIHYS